MSVAVRLTKLDSSGNDIGHIDFERKEIMDTDVLPFINSNVQRAQKGAPTLFIITDEYHVINVNVRIYGTTTESKLTELRNFILAGGIVRVYPKYYEDPTIYYDCFIMPETLQLISAFSGESMAGKKLKLQFLETTFENQYVIDEDVSGEIVIE